LGYSLDFVENMTKIAKDFRNHETDFSVKIISGLDDACTACPNRGVRLCEANAGSNKHVVVMDQKVIKHLNLVPWKNYSKSQLLKLIAKKIEPSDLDYLCKGCSWLQYGFCKEGIVDLKRTFRQHERIK
jgi:uncharacterized protein